MREPQGDEAVVDYRKHTLTMVRQDVPPTLRWTGAVVVALALVNEVVPPPTQPIFFIILTSLGVTIYGLGVWFRRADVPATLILWTYVAVVVLLNTGILLMFDRRPVPWDFMYVAVILTGFAPLTFHWSSFLVGSGLSLLETGIVLAHHHLVHWFEWGIAVVAAAVTGAMLLRQRIQTVRELADAQFARDQLVESDSLTGLFNRRGIHSRVEVVWAGAQRRGEHVNIAFIDIVGLKGANDANGHEFGDRIIVEVANAIRASVRREDLVARWGGDEFVVLAKGDVAPTERLQERVLAQLRMRDLAFEGRWRSDITVGAASALADEVGFEELLERADADMYGRRQRLRG